MKQHPLRGMEADSEEQYSFRSKRADGKIIGKIEGTDGRSPHQHRYVIEPTPVLGISSNHRRVPLGRECPFCWHASLIFRRQWRVRLLWQNRPPRFAVLRVCPPLDVIVFQSRDTGIAVGKWRCLLALRDSSMTNPPKEINRGGVGDDG